MNKEKRKFTIKKQSEENEKENSLWKNNEEKRIIE